MRQLASKNDLTSSTSSSCSSILRILLMVRRKVNQEDSGGRLPVLLM